MCHIALVHRSRVVCLGKGWPRRANFAPLIKFCEMLSVILRLPILGYHMAAPLMIALVARPNQSSRAGNRPDFLCTRQQAHRLSRCDQKCGPAELSAIEAKTSIHGLAWVIDCENPALNPFISMPSISALKPAIYWALIGAASDVVRQSRL